MSSVILDYTETKDREENKMNWIDATEKTPEKDGDYLVIQVTRNTANSPQLMTWTEVYEWSGGNHYTPNIAYWAEIPKKPRLKKKHRSYTEFVAYITYHDGTDTTRTHHGLISAYDKKEAEKKLRKIEKMYRDNGTFLYSDLTKR